MSVKDEQIKNLEEEVVVENSTAVVVQDEEAKKAKIMGVAKKVGKVAAVVGVGVLGFFLGTKAAKKSDYTESEYVESEVIESDVE